ncbi:MAG: AAA family ATPase [Magnetococcales bacterium]|nr:AAA family ATPase [Magnetococcales bacterium]
MELLHQGRKSRVIRLRREDGTSVIYKILHRVAPDTDEMARFRYEYALTTSLAGVEGVIRCDGLIRHEECLALVLEDIGGISLDRGFPGRCWSVDEWLHWGLILAGIVNRVHAAGVIHKDITPANIIWNPENGALRLIDFGIADRLLTEVAEARPPTRLAGTLAFLAPEQTGRMNRPVDFRSDLYSLGATFYALLTGHPPFASDDPLCLIADHLAKDPEPLHQLRPEIPEIISRIVLKLLAKEPSDRYQSALGLEMDLRHCQDLKSKEPYHSLFPLGRHERVERLRFSEKLYGREKEWSILSDALERVQKGGRLLLLLSGASGTGKSALGRELRQPVAKARGRFAGGKFDQLRRERPMAALMDAISDLLHQRQADTIEVFENWRGRVLQELGDSLAVLTRQFPELDALFPHTPPLADLPPIQAAVRLRQAVIRLLQTLGDEGHPLVLLLDDLQWADLAFLDLLGELIGETGPEWLLVVGAYRDGEVPPSHPLALLITQWEEGAAPLVSLALTPLSRRATQLFLADTLATSTKRVAPLVELMQKRSGGNPFHLRTLMTECKDRGWLHHHGTEWMWELESIGAWQMPEDVIALLLEQLGKLGNSSRHLLITAACLGHAFDLETLTAASGKSRREVAEEVESLLNSGCWLPMNGEWRLVPWMDERRVRVSYRFAHDRVQEAALALLVPRHRDRFRLELGRRLLIAFPNVMEDDFLFVVAEQVAGLPSHLLGSGESQQMASLLLAAGRRAKATVAFATALSYLEAGMVTLGVEGWQNDFALALALRHEAAECARGAQDLGLLERLWFEVVQHVFDLKDLLPILAQLAPLYIAQSLVAQMKQLGLEVLRHQKLPVDITLALVARQEYAVRKALVTALSGRDAITLADFPLHSDASLHDDTRFLLGIFTGLFFGAPALLFRYVSSVVLRMVQEERAVSDAAWCYSWISAGLMGSGRQEEVECGVLLNTTAGLMLTREPKYEPPAIPAVYVYLVFCRPWREPLSHICSGLMDLYPQAVDRGDQAFAAYTIGAHFAWRAVLGEPVDEYLKFSARWLPLLEATGHDNLIALVHQVYLPEMQEWHGEGSSLWRERALSPALSGNLNNLFHYLERTGQAAFLRRDFMTALEKFEAAVDLGWQMGGSHVVMPCIITYLALSIIHLLPGMIPSERRKRLRQLAGYRKRLAIWSKLNPDNFFHMERLVEAAYQRDKGHPEKTVALCEQAIAHIQSQSGEVWLYYEALALELAGESLRDLRWDFLARHMLCRAMRAWSRYGAVVLVREGEKRYGQLVQGWNNAFVETDSSILTDTTTSDDFSAIELIDYPSLLRASQVIASENSHAGVTGRLLSLLLVNAGAERASLYLPRQGEWSLACEGIYQSGEVRFCDAERSDAKPDESLLGMVRSVARSREAVVLDDATSDAQWSHLSGLPSSLLCAPLLHLGEAMGVLLLTHDHSKGVFTRERVEMVSVLGSQAAISMTNARIMEELQLHIREIRRLGAHLEDLSEAEKRRLASEVHDELGNTLTVAKISLSILEKRQQDEGNRQRCQEIYRLTDDALRVVRRIAQSLRPDVLDLVGLRAALEGLASSLRDHAGLECRVVAADEEWQLDESRRTALFRIAQEALTNVMRHAGARSVIITLCEDQGAIVLEVIDDGCGITPERIRDVHSFGLAGMRERAERLGGLVSVAVPTSGGTRITARIPLVMQ